MRKMWMVLAVASGLISCAPSVLRTDARSVNEAVNKPARACMKKDWTACARVGNVFLETDPHKALFYYQRACEQGEREGCYGWGFVLALEHSELTDWPKSRELLERACVAGEPRGCAMLGLQHMFGKGDLPVDAQRAAKFFEPACRLGEPIGCFNLGHLIADGRLSGTDEQALDLFTKSCAPTVGLGCWNAAILHKNRGADGWSSCVKLVKKTSAVSPSLGSPIPSRVLKCLQCQGCTPVIGQTATRIGHFLNHPT